MKNSNSDSSTGMKKNRCPEKLELLPVVSFHMCGNDVNEYIRSPVSHQVFQALRNRENILRSVMTKSQSFFLFFNFFVIKVLSFAQTTTK